MRRGWAAFSAVQSNLIDFQGVDNEFTFFGGWLDKDDGGTTRAVGGAPGVVNKQRIFRNTLDGNGRATRGTQCDSCKVTSTCVVYPLVDPALYTSGISGDVPRAAKCSACARARQLWEREQSARPRLSAAPCVPSAGHSDG